MLKMLSFELSVHLAKFVTVGNCLRLKMSCGFRIRIKMIRIRNSGSLPINKESCSVMYNSYFVPNTLMDDPFFLRHFFISTLLG
jgi:hypothetical protein